MEFNWLRDFISLAASLSFSRAAEERHVSQPAFSRRIRALENAVGAQLINRDTLPLSLTPAGEIFLGQAQSMLRKMEETIERCQIADAEDARVLRLAASQSLYTTYHGSHIQPQVDRGLLSVELGSVSWPAEKFVGSLVQGGCDLMLCYWHPALSFLTPLDQKGFDHICLARDRFIPVARPGPDRTPLFRLPNTDKSRVPLISYGTASVLRPIVDDLLMAHSGTANTLLVSQNALSSSVKALILEGFGLGWLPSRFCDAELESGALVRAGGPAFETDLEIRLYRRRDNTKPALQPLWEHFLAETGDEPVARAGASVTPLRR
ncbi:DNA-binding transcriptional regulator, LysR family [Poseidonocella pacifica]|uniref:DNA-binding transcriptional regulator, LysR family n=1 Tax=Poseidonocella pacifica TaxID=871651 RepID=A0A1I0YY25_9RHOB|nr:LysR family transcriptional regulator [Poseidonocella pacifica]SFB18171.1 DNA-binding transcriptional regulator, LysR family [Poseidonocella pacifica]